MPTLAVGIDARQATVGGRIAARAIGQLRKQTVLLQQQQKLLSAQFVKTGAAAKTGGMGMRGMMGGMLGIAGVMKMVQGWTKFDTSMRRIQGVIGGSDGVDAKMKALAATARQLGAATSFTASEAADSMLMLSRAGMSAGEVIASTGAVLDLAKVAAIGLQQSATLTADSLKQFSMDASRAREAADTLAFASNNANTDITQLGEGLKMAGPIAAAAGMSLADTSVVLGILADNGLKASLGGTGIRAMLASLGDPSDSASAALTRLGIDVKTLGDKIQTQGGLREIMAKLGPDIMGMTDAIRIFSRRGAAAALIMGKSTKKWKDFDDRMKDSEGTVRNSAKLIEEGLGDAFKQLVSAVSEASLAMGEGGFGDALKATVQWLTEGVRALTDWSVGVTKAGASAALFIGVLGVAGIAGALTKLVIGFKAAKVAAGGFFALLGKHPIMLAATAIITLGSAMIAFSSDAAFASKELVEFNKTMKGMSTTLDSVTRSWDAAVRFTDVRKQIQALSTLKSKVMEVGEASVAMAKAGGMIETIGIKSDPGKQFAEMRETLAAVGVEGFGTRQAGVPSAGAGTRGMPFTTTSTPWETGGGGKMGKTSGVRVTKELDPAAVSTETARVLGELDAKMKALRDSMIETTESVDGQVKGLADKLDVTDLVKKEMGALNDEMMMQQRVAQSSAREISNLNEFLRVTDRLTKATGLSHEKLTEKYKKELVEVGKLIVKKGEGEDETEADKQRKAAKASAAAAKRDEEVAFADSLASSIVTPLIEGLKSGDFKQVGVSMYQNLLSAILEEMVAKPAMKAIAAAISGASATAAGAAYSGGVQRFASGGVVGGPTTFGIAGGRTGLMGEDGPEAIMPLKRLPSGKLGVQAQGGGTIINDSRTINIQVQDDAGFRRTIRQLDRDQARRIDKGMK